MIKAEEFDPLTPEQRTRVGVEHEKIEKMLRDRVKVQNHTLNSTHEEAIVIASEWDSAGWRVKLTASGPTITITHPKLDFRPT